MNEKNRMMTLTNVSFQHHEHHVVLKDITFSIGRGDRIGIVGPNGTGKTTLFLLMAGVLKPIAGEITLFGKNVKPGKFYPELGMVFQNQDDQILSPTVQEDIAFGPYNMGLSEENINKRVEHALDMMGIVDLKDRPPHQLSGGEKRLVALAGVIAMDPAFIIYDEPTSNLDMRYRRKLIDYLMESHTGQEGFMVASHDLEFILEVCNRVILMDEGVVIKDGSPGEVLGNEEWMSAHGLEVPYSLK